MQYIVSKYLIMYENIDIYDNRHQLKYDYIYIYISSIPLIYTNVYYIFEFVVLI